MTTTIFLVFIALISGQAKITETMYADALARCQERGGVAHIARVQGRLNDLENIDTLAIRCVVREDAAPSTEEKTDK